MIVAPMAGVRPMVQVVCMTPVDSDDCDVRLSMFITRPDGVDPARTIWPGA
jgi:hypothetical protein